LFGYSFPPTPIFHGPCLAGDAIAVFHTTAAAPTLLFHHAIEEEDGQGSLSLSLLIIKKGMKGIGAEEMKGRTRRSQGTSDVLPPT
jgi:hypothetical protein